MATFFNVAINFTEKNIKSVEIIKTNNKVEDLVKILVI